jgi:NB-ARC domain
MSDNTEDDAENSPESARLIASIGMRSIAARDISDSYIHTGDNVFIDGQRDPAGTAPALPPLVIGRDEAVQELKLRLGVTPSDRRSTSTQVITAVRGWPGVGKTTLVASLAHDAQVRALYPNGILWMSLGRDPTILSKLAEWGRALGTSAVTSAQSIQEATAQLTALVRGRRMLLILDDVWVAEHGRAFMVGGEGCATLITTRSKTVAQQLSPTADATYKLEVLSEGMAVELLKALAPTVVERHDAACRELMQELDRLPLAIQVAGRLLDAEADSGFDVTVLLKELREGARLLEARAPVDITDVEHETTPTVAALLQKSTERLDNVARDCFAYLGVFAPEPATFDLAALQAVWEMTDPKPVVDILVARGLIEPSGNGRFQLHSLLALHARSFLT